MTITTRAGKGSALTHAELDENFNDLDGRLVLTPEERVVISYTSGLTHVRHVESFGAVAVGYFETPVDNLAEIQAAIDWSSATGGTVLFGGGIYGHDGALVAKSFVKLKGVGKGGSWLKQMSATASSTIECFDGADQSLYGIEISGLRIMGNWNVNFNQDNSADHDVPLIFIRGDMDGPDDPVALTRFGVSGLADPHHVIEDCEFYASHGDAIRLQGRGEMRVRNNKIWRCARHGIFVESPDNWITSNTVFAVGDIGILVNAGNTRGIDNKTWFCGQASYAEFTGAGVSFVGNGQRNNSFMNHHSQDCYGAGLKTESSILFTGILDECGGGRLTQQGNGWTGTRTEPRCFLEMAGGSNCNITVMVNGGDLLDPIFGDLVAITGSGTRNNNIHIQTDNISYTDAVSTTAGYRNADRHNVIYLNGELVEGWRTPAELLDGAHGINNGDSVHSVVLTDDGAGVRSQAIRQEDGSWVILSDGDLLAANNLSDIADANTAATNLGLEPGATADQTDAEIETAYNTQVAVIGQAEAEAGVSTTVRRWTAQRVAQAIAALAGASNFDTGAGGPASAPSAVNRFYRDTSTGDLYYSIGTSTTADWVQVFTASGGSLLSDLTLTDASVTADLIMFEDVTDSTAKARTVANFLSDQGIVAGATVNATDAALRDRASHTGTQAISTVTGLQTALDGKAASLGADDNYVTDAEKVVIGNTSGTNTGDQDLSGLQSEPSEGPFANGDKTKLDGITAGATPTNTANVTAAGALMDSEVTNLADVKAFDPSDYATAAQGGTADSALQNVSEDATPALGGDLDGAGNEIANFVNSVVTASGALTTAAHSGNVIKTSGNVTVPTSAGFTCTIIAGGAHTITFNGTVSAAMATGDLMTVVVESGTVIHAGLMVAADKVAFA